MKSKKARATKEIKIHIHQQLQIILLMLYMEQYIQRILYVINRVSRAGL